MVPEGGQKEREKERPIEKMRGDKVRLRNKELRLFVMLHNTIILYISFNK